VYRSKEKKFFFRYLSELSNMLQVMDTETYIISEVSVLHQNLKT